MSAVHRVRKGSNSQSRHTTTETSHNNSRANRKEQLNGEAGENTQTLIVQPEPADEANSNYQKPVTTQSSIMVMMDDFLHATTCIAPSTQRGVYLCICMCVSCLVVFSCSFKLNFIHFL